MELRRLVRVRVLRALTTAAPVIAAAFGVLTLVSPAPTAAVQSVPYLINFQGRLTDNNGNVLTDGSYNVKFRFFDASSAGTNLWEGDRVYSAADHRITVQNGLFNIQFGDSTQGDPALSPSLFNTQTHPSLYLEVELPTPGTATCASNGCATWTEGAMTPRQPLASAAYAFNSDTLDGLDSADFGQITATNNFTATNTFSKSGGAGIILSGTPASAGSLLQLGSALSSGNASGTLIGANGTFTGDLLNLQVSNSTKLKVDNSGNLTLASGAVFAVGASTGSSATCSGGNVLQNQVVVGGIVTGGTCASAGGGAATNLSNLTTTAINQSLVPNANNTLDLGSATNAWRNLYIAGVDTGTTTTTLTIGGTNATAINLGRSSLGVTVPASGTVALNLTGTPATSGSSSLIQLSGALSGGSTSGTYIGANPASFSGDFENFQIGGATRLKVTSFGDVSGGVTSMGVSSTTSGSATNKTSMTLASAASFTTGYYIQLNDAACANGSTCYAKITGISTNTLTITPALSWANGSTVNEYYVPEIGGTDLTSTLTSRYGRGYFIAGVATGNGTTYYNEDGITSSLSSFNLLTSASTINIGGASTTVTLPGALSVGGQSVVNASGQINGAQLQSGSVANTALANPSLSIGTSGNLAGGGSVSLGGSLNLSFSNSPTFSTSVTTPSLNATSSFLLQPTSDSSTAFQVLSSTGTSSRGVLVVGTSNTQVSADANLIIQSSVSVPSITSAVYAGNNTTGSLSGAAGTTYFYRVSAIVGSETAASGETWVSSSSFGTISAPSAPTTTAVTTGGSLNASQTYSYKVTFVTANGETVASAASGSQTTTNTKLTIPVTVPTYTGAGSGIVTARKLYRTAGNGSTYLLVNTGTSLQNNTTTSFNDGTADSSLGAAEPTTNTATTNANEVTVTFPAFASATGYRIYRGTSTHGENAYQTTGSCAGTCTFTDTGAAGTAGTPVEPTAGRVGIGTSSPNYALDVTGNVSATSAYIANGNVGQTQTCGSGNTFSGLTITGGIVTATGSCTSIGGGSASATLQSAYANSTLPQITLTSGGGALTVRDAATPLGTDLLDIQNNGGTTTYFGVSSTGITTSGNITASAGTINGATLQQGGASINTGGATPTLSDVDYLDSAQTISAAKTFTGTATFSKSSGAGAIFSGTAASAGAMLQFGSVAALNGGSTNGTYIGADPASYTGDFINLAIGATNKFKVDNSGNLTAGGTINGATISGGSLSNAAVNGLSVSSGTITVGTWQGTAIAAADGGTGQTTYAIGDILYASASNALSKLSEPASAGSCLLSGATGTSGPSWGSCSSASGANQTLSNLTSPTAVNQNLLPDSNNARDLGSATAVWAHTFTGLVDAGTTTTTLGLGTSNATAVTLGNTNSGTITAIQGGTGTGAVSIGSVGTSTVVSTINIANTSNATGAQSVSIGSGANASSTSTLEGSTLSIGNGATAHTINIGTGAAAQTLTIGSTNSTSSTLIQAGSGDITLNVPTGNSVVIGSGTADANQVLLQLDSFTTFADTASCATTTNQGAVYYNANTNTIRSCVGGNWEDVVTTSGLGLLLFGVVPDSGTGGGDLGSVTSAGVNGPCKVSWASSTTVKIVQGCTAYSGGRKVVIPDNTTPTGTLSFSNNRFVHVCLTGTGNQPAFSASGTEAADMPTFSVNNPVLCLADISTTSSAIGSIFDVRTFTTTNKTFATLNATTGILGGIVSQTTTANVVQLSSATTQLIRGVIVATAGSAATNNTINMIIANRGPQYVKATTTAQTAGVSVLETTTAGYSGSGTASTTAFASLGESLLATTGTCAAAATCIDSQLTDINIR